MAREIPVGIDLGTTFSAVATLDGSGRSVMLSNIEGELLTPSIVLFSEEEVVVGKDARSATITNPDLVAEWVKRDMGASRYSRPIHGQYLPPEVIQGCILRKLRADIVRELGPDVRCVITVPAYFDELRRKATADAGEMAGLKVLDIVNEPTAAALVFGEAQGYLAPGGTPKADMTVLIYDLGGGTFDCTILKLAQGNIQTIATDGDVQLGGHDWDMRLLEHLADQFQKQHNTDLRQSKVALARLMNSVIEAKHALSAREQTIVRVDYRGQLSEFPVTRKLFAELTVDLLERTAYTTRQLVADAKMEWKDVDRVLLVGGSTRMPMVVEMLRNLSGKEPDRSVNPDEAVARGAAIYASYLLGKGGNGARPSFAVTNVNSHSLGIEGIDPATMRKTNVILIPRNTPLPARTTQRFTTKSPNQRSIVVQVLEGESSLPGDCTAIGRTVVRDLPEGLPQNWPIEVTFEYAENGRLGVRASVTGTHQSATMDLERSVGLNGAGIARWKQPIETAAGFDAFERMVHETLIQGGDAPAMPTSACSSPTIPLPPALMQMASAQPSLSPIGPPVAPPVAVPLGQAAPVGDGTAGLPLKQAIRRTSSSMNFRRWLLRVIGYVTSALAGLLLTYLLLSKIRPDIIRSLW